MKYSITEPKVILVTGASSGLGSAIANHLAAAGHIVYGTSRFFSEDSAVRMLTLDLTDINSIRYAVYKVVAMSGRIDVLINNAGIDMAGPLEAMDAGPVAQLFEVNVFGTTQLISQVIPHMRNQGRGLIINMSSLAAANGLPYRAFYAASKAALERITESLRIETAPFGIQACYIQAGCFHTSINENRLLPDSMAIRHYPKWPAVSDQIDHRVHEGLEPLRMASLIEKIIRSGRVRSNYRIGRSSEKISAAWKGMFPHRIMEIVLKKYFKA